MEPLNRQTHAIPRWHTLRAWLVGLLLLSGLVVTVTHFREIEHFVQLLRRAEPLWLILALLFQSGTYFSVAAVWHQSLRRGGVRYSLLSLVPLGIAKLFSDQAMPSGGMSGIAFFVAALGRHGVSIHLCMATMLVSLVGYYAAYLIAAITSVMLLWFHHKINVWIISITIVFCLVAVAIPASALFLRRWGKKDLPALLLRIPGLNGLLRAFGNAPGELLRNPALFMITTLLHGSIFLLDSATLWVMLQAVGQHVSFWVAFPSFVIASIVATLSPIPLGLGTFETTCVAMLGVLGIPLEAALTATLLLRGFTLWLPMLPGLWLIRREMR
jgi:uncharacterized protein (TIRG00374 family)